MFWRSNILTAILAVLMIGLIYSAEPAQIKSPGATGMNNTSDVDALRETDSRYSENVDVTGWLGAVKRRGGIRRVPTSYIELDGISGYYDPIDGYKIMVGVVPASDSIYNRCVGTYADGSPDEVTYADSIYFSFPTTGMGYIRVSDSFGKIVNTDVPDDINTRKIGLCYAKNNKYHDFLQYEYNSVNLLIHSDGSGIPQAVLLTDYDDTPSPDTAVYKPRVVDLSLPRPGQPSVRTVDCGCTSTLDGIYEYCYARVYSHHPAVDSGYPYISDTSPHSIVIRPIDECVAISGFLGHPFRAADTSYISGTARGSRILLFRREISKLEGYVSDSGSMTMTSNWQLIEDFYIDIDETPLIIDSGQSIDTTLADLIILPGGSGGHLPPGAIKKKTSYYPETLSVHFEYCDSLVWVTWSWFDPVTYLESPLAPVDYSWYGQICDSVHHATDTTYHPWHWCLPYLSPDQCPTDFIRIYRTVVKTGMTGAADSTVFYCLYQIPVDNALHSWEGSQIVLGIVPDSILEAGNPVDFSVLDQGYSSTQSSDTYYTALDSTPYTFENEAFTIDGEQIVRPEYVVPLVIPFKDMENANSRLWGIGDPLYPQRLYYSGYDDLMDWNLNYYLSLDEGEPDELVGIEKIEGTTGDVLYGFKHNSIYLLTGTDPEYDLSIYRVTSNNGALNRHAIIKTNDEVYFMSPRFKIYRMNGDQDDWISAPIQDWLDSVFTTANKDSIRAYALEDRVCFTQPWAATPKSAVYNYVSGTWSIESYGTSNYPSTSPIMTFLYDTLQNNTGFSDYWIYGKGYGDMYHMSVPWDSFYDTIMYITAGGETTAAISSYDIAYQSPHIGDGQYPYQIISAEYSLEVDSGESLISQVYDKDDNLLATDTVITDNNSFENYFFTYPEHADKYLSVRVKGYIREINNVNINYRRLGRAPVN